MPENQRNTFSDDEARAILSRALEIDARGPTTTEEDLRAIASELGVSSASLDLALRERAALARGADGARNRSVTTTIAGLGLPLGAMAGTSLVSLGLFSGMVPYNLTFLVGLAASGALLVKLGRTITLRSFNARNTALWAGYAAGTLAAIALLGGGAGDRIPWLIGVTGSLGYWITSTLLGSAAVVAIRRSLRTDAQDPPAPVPLVTRISQAMRGAVARVAGWFTTRRVRLIGSMQQVLGAASQRMRLRMNHQA